MPLTINAGTGLNFGNDVLQVWREITVNVACPTPTAVVGCGHGYWKNHAEQWPAGFGDKTVADLFAVPEAYGDVAGDPLMTVLNYPTGRSNTVVGKGKILLVQAVAAYLNAAKFGVWFSYLATTIQSDVNGALASDDEAQILGLKDAYDTANNIYCPLP
jgi:hypothetical protein